MTNDVSVTSHGATDRCADWLIGTACHGRSLTDDSVCTMHTVSVRLLLKATSTDTDRLSYAVVTCCALLHKQRQRAKYASLSSTYEFVPRAVETFGAYDEAALNFMKDVGRRISAMTLDQRSFGNYLMQRRRPTCDRNAAVVHQSRRTICFIGLKQKAIM